MSHTKEYPQTKRLGAIMLLVGWIMGIALIGLLYQKLIFTPPEPDITITDNTAQMVIHKDRDGHFRLLGYINNQATNFLIDTGASVIGIPGHLAESLQLEKDFEITTHTANGTAVGFTTEIKQLALGPIEFTNVRGILIPNMQGNEVLLGMNVLKHFTLRKKGTTLTLSREK